jgi:hypothetical protein
VAPEDSCFPALVLNTNCSIMLLLFLYYRPQDQV